MEAKNIREGVISVTRGVGVCFLVEDLEKERDGKDFNMGKGDTVV